MKSEPSPTDDEIAEQAIEQDKVDAEGKVTIADEGVRVLHPGDPDYPEAPEKEADRGEG